MIYHIQAPHLKHFTSYSVTFNRTFNRRIGLTTAPHAQSSPPKERVHPQMERALLQRPLWEIRQQHQ
jgi:hypothetical protein